MFEYASVSSSGYDTDSLVGQINERAAGGWEVVSIVAAGSGVTAFLKRESTGASSPTTPEVAAEPVVTEPAGWGAQPESDQSMADIAPETVAATDTSFIE